MDGGPTVIDDASVKQATDLHPRHEPVCGPRTRETANVGEHLSCIRALYRERAHTLVDT